MGREALERLWTSIVGLGVRRLVALAFVGVAVMAVLGVGAYYLGRPAQETLYTGLTRDDVARIGAALKDAGIDFDVAADGETVTVNYGDTARARMLLAEKGLPESANSGYDLFDKVGSFGLTSFMQNVTKTRALEGELARTIQSMDGIKAARVHLVLPDTSSLRSQQQAASASVVIRTEMPTDTGPAQAIRHLVAAAVPGLRVDNVTVLNTEGTLLASGDDIESASAGKMAAVEQTVNREIEDKVRRTLTPYLGLGNFQVSVVARLNLDRSTTNEVIFDPSSRVERSVRTVRENALAQNSSSDAAASVQQNLPDQTNQARQPGQELQREQRPPRRDDQLRGLLADYRDRARRLQDREAVDRRAGQQEPAGRGRQAGRRRAAGRASDDGHRAARVGGLGLQQGPRRPAQGGLGRLRRRPRRGGAAARLPERADGAGGQPVQLAGAGGGRRGAWSCSASGPAVRMIVAQSPRAVAAAERAAVEAGHAPALGTPMPAMAQVGDGDDNVNLIEDVTKRMSRSPQKRLEQIVEYDEAQAAAILRQWLHQDEAA